VCNDILVNSFETQHQGNSKTCVVVEGMEPFVAWCQILPSRDCTSESDLFHIRHSE